MCGSTFARAQDAAPAEAPAAAAPSTAPAISPELAARLDELEQETRITARKLELAQEAAASKPPTASVSADEKGFGISSPDKSFEIKFHSLLQLDGRRVFFSDDAALRDRVDTFLVRRARPIFDATLFGLVDLRITPDFGNNTVALYDAYGDAHPTPWLRLRVGKFKPPVGLERLQNDAYVPIIERAVDQNLTAQRDVGVQLWGDIANAALRYELAWLNGNADGTITDLDNEHAKTYAARLFFRPFQLGDLKAFGDLGVGIAFETGNEKGSPTNTWLGTFKAESQQQIFTYLAPTDPTLVVFSAHRHTRVNPQLYYYVGGFGLLAEWLWERQGVQKGATTASLDNNAGHVTASFVFGGDNGYEGVKPKKPADWAHKELGAIELAARYGWLSADKDAFVGWADESKSVQAANAWSFAANWWLNRNIRFAATYELTTFTGGAGTTKVVADRATEKVGFARFQVTF